MNYFRKNLLACVFGVAVGLGSCGGEQKEVSGSDQAVDGNNPTTIRIAVASNFANTLQDLADHFHANTGHEVVLAVGSTGKHFAQIVHGAPFDAYFAADQKRPELLEEQGAIIAGSRFTYAVGKLILWSPKEGYVGSDGQGFEELDFRHLSIANPKLAPYGRAAQEVMQKLGVWQPLSQRFVRGENIGQAFQFVQSGNAELGFVALSQVMRPGAKMEGSWWVVPQELYGPIEQQAVQLRSNPIAKEFLAFVQSDIGLEIIRGYGYGTP